MKHSTNNEKLYFEINKDQYNLFYFNLKDKNGNIYLKSGSYTQKTNCLKGIRSIIINSKNEDRFGAKQTYEETWVFYLKDENGQIIAVSPYYFDTIVEAINFIENLKSLSLKTPVIDNTK
ncbi:MULTISPECIES: YegP family protein [unclassified Apibacter]|uniref:YegP family protein n=1 Tax=unclassified Apibacter TaxID=2630820 RepID=UPI001322D945|nr:MULTISPECIES: YegP family protein [unclassified Apibacter]MCX8676239.1 YegP family protein [Apibacter sp. B3919]MXO23709.1 DUF1508 domain-containing protein [Apibacter sp. B3924]MXO26613.1 DUF1508 domain-containing protein [Apibacter sp. B3813]MXO29480.1 DUF1508 domain-containing protein [Apibacter sp. B3913]MXO31432.1 DUF1508 domain-containing protein [Apibacter sp. B3912]